MKFTTAFCAVFAADMAHAELARREASVTTLFVASTKPISSPTGTVVSTLVTSYPNPVSVPPVLPTTHLSTSLTTVIYSQPVTVINTAIPLTGVGRQFPLKQTAVPAQQAAPRVAASGDIFQAIDTNAPPSMFSRKAVPFSLLPGTSISKPIQTNKFWGNLLVGSQTQTVFTQPYGLWWAKDSSNYGLGIAYTESSQRVYGPNANANPVEYYINPLKIKSMVMSANELTSSNMGLQLSDNSALSVTASLTGGGGSIQLPMSIGMGLVTGIYNNLTPRIFSEVGFMKILKQKNLSNGIQKWIITLNNNKVWNVYVKTPNNQNFDFSIKSVYELAGNQKINGLIMQIAVAPSNGDGTLDKAAGAYPTYTKIYGSASNDVATYGIQYSTAGSSISGNMLFYALTHHLDSATSTTIGSVTGLVLQSRTKGFLIGVLGSKLECKESLNVDLQWLPYQTGKTTTKVSSSALQLLASTVNSELSQNMGNQVNVNSNYFSGKALDKFAYILLVASEILGSKSVTTQGLASLKQVFSPWLSNTQQIPFMYDTVFKGVTSSAANINGGSVNDEFGAPLYNDHHFHYGYLIHTAAVIGLLDQKYGDGSWVTQNKAWVNSLVRDVANPSESDSYFPVFRSFDFYSGHSWASGVFEIADGKNEESTSEDYNFAYGMKLWGQVVGDKGMEARGDLMLAIMKRTMSYYFLYQDNNSIQPSNFIKNRVSGILFENKVDHTTFFGTNIEYIQGIHMLPITGASGLIRPSAFVQQEWNSLLSPIVGGLTSGWAGILRSNQALIDPTSSYNWFSSSSFKSDYLDSGASRSWYLAFAASLGGSS